LGVRQQDRLKLSSPRTSAIGSDRVVLENYDVFTIISQGEKVVRHQVSSYQSLNEKIIGLALTYENKDEFCSHMMLQIIMSGPPIVNI
jgi:hypothetical protein